mmetsp:Transcript_11665/g.27940  ORF Transcript_11665/g.27940 Transcript_11665/m.27940 type:complete len:570 (-) Transcript_11665:213-1922(-)
MSSSPLTRSQQTALAVLPKVFGSLSFCSSWVIIVTVLRDVKGKRSKVYHRLVMGMSLADVSSSFALALSTWPIPSNSGILWAVGTTQTCTAQGFFTQFGISSPLYNVSLSFYYLLAVRYGWKEHELKRVEPYFHVLPVAWALLTGIAGLPLQIFNSANLWCWIGDGPPGSGRNENTDPYRWGFFYGPLWTAIVIVTINLFLLFSYVRTVTLRSERYARMMHLPPPRTATNTTLIPATAGAGAGTGAGAAETNGHTREAQLSSSTNDHSIAMSDVEQMENSHGGGNDGDGDGGADAYVDTDEAAAVQQQLDKSFVQTISNADDGVYYDQGYSSINAMSTSHHGSSSKGDINHFSVEEGGESDNSGNDAEQPPQQQEPPCNALKTGKGSRFSSHRLSTLFNLTTIPERSSRLSPPGAASTTTANATTANATTSTTANRLALNKATQFLRRRRQVANQCLRYSVAFYWTWIPITLVRILQTMNLPPVYGLFVLAAMNTPMQGLPNFVVYLYPLIMKARKQIQLDRQQQNNKNERNNSNRNIVNNNIFEWIRISLSPASQSAAAVTADEAVLR